MTKALVPLADGCEEIEAVTIIDVLRRAGWTVTAAGLKPGVVLASRGVKIVPDTVWADLRLEDFDLIVLPGGKGVELLAADARVLKALAAFHRAGKWVCAVCAAPLVLQKAGVLDGRKATCFPGVAAELTGAVRVDSAVVRDGRLITSQGPGTTMAFALAIVEAVDGKAKAAELARALVA